MEKLYNKWVIRTNTKNLKEIKNLIYTKVSKLKQNK